MNFKFNDFVSEEEFEGTFEDRPRRRRRRSQISKSDLANNRLSQKARVWNSDRRVRAFVVYHHVFGDDELRTEVVLFDSFKDAFRWARHMHYDCGRDLTFKVGKRTYHIGVKINPVA